MRLINLLTAFVLTGTCIALAQNSPRPAGWAGVSQKFARDNASKPLATTVAGDCHCITGTWHLSAKLDDTTTIEGLLTLAAGEGPFSGPAVLTTNMDLTLPLLAAAPSGNWTRTGAGSFSATTLGFVFDTTNENQPAGMLKMTHAISFDGTQLTVHSHIDLPDGTSFSFDWSGTRVPIEQPAM
ncbi:MAG TPA: hypothetical protein VKU01_09165 [Bryobacteraceae bacterium]|nr:hypothetical protein [Bryobacteraceae bacterium]